jgi:hypothetical protein
MAKCCRVGRISRHETRQMASPNPTFCKRSVSLGREGRGQDGRTLTGLNILSRGDSVLQSLPFGFALFGRQPFEGFLKDAEKSLPRSRDVRVGDRGGLFGRRSLIRRNVAVCGATGAGTSPSGLVSGSASGVAASGSVGTSTGGVAAWASCPISGSGAGRWSASG